MLLGHSWLLWPYFLGEQTFHSAHLQVTYLQTRSESVPIITSATKHDHSAKITGNYSIIQHVIKQMVMCHVQKPGQSNLKK